MPIFKINENGKHELVRPTNSMLEPLKEAYIKLANNLNPANCKLHLSSDMHSASHAARLKINQGRDNGLVSIPVHKNEDRTTVQEILEDPELVIADMRKSDFKKAVPEALLATTAGYYLYNHQEISEYVYKSNRNSYRKNDEEELNDSYKEFIKKLNKNYSYANINRVIAEKRDGEK